MYHYAQLNEEGISTTDCWLPEEIEGDNIIPIPDDFYSLGKRYVNGKWEDVEENEE